MWRRDRIPLYSKPKVNIAQRQTKALLFLIERCTRTFLTQDFQRCIIYKTVSMKVKSKLKNVDKYKI